METLEELKAIRDNAPDGADYITLSNKYIQIDGVHCKVFNSLGVWSVPLCNVSDVFIDDKPRSLSDIERIIEQQEMLEVAWSAIQEAGYEDFCSELRKYIEALK